MLYLLGAAHITIALITTPIPLVGLWVERLLSGKRWIPIVAGSVEMTEIMAASSDALSGKPIAAWRVGRVQFRLMPVIPINGTAGARPVHIPKAGVGVTTEGVIPNVGNVHRRVFCIAVG